MKFKRFFLMLQSQKNKFTFSYLLKFDFFASLSILRILPLALSIIFLASCATTPEMDWDTFMKEMATERNAEGDTGIPVGPDKRASELPPAPENDPVIMAGEVTIQPDCVLQVSVREDSGLDGEYTFFDRSEDIRTSSIYLFEGEAVIVAGEGSDFPPKYFVGKFDLHQRTYAIMGFDKIEGKYLYYYMLQNKNYLVRYAVGSTVKSLRLPIFQKMIIGFPSLEEQTKIANFLSSIDTRIEQVQKQLDSTKEFKKALLQQMFV